MADAAWKRHEREVAAFFNTERHKSNLTQNHLLTGTSPSDVVVKTKKWLKALGKEEWPVVFDHFVIECKYTGNPTNRSDFYWQREFHRVYQEIPKKVDKDHQIPIITFGDWIVFRLGHFPIVYKGLFASELPKEKWLRQLLQRFWFVPTNRNAPAYLQGWHDQTKGWKVDKLGRVLPAVCLGSRLSLRGNGGGKVMIVHLSEELLTQPMPKKPI